MESGPRGWDAQMRADVRSRIKAFVRGGARTAPLAVACTTRARILGRETLIAPTARRTGCVPETSIQGLVPGRVAPRGDCASLALGQMEAKARLYRLEAEGAKLASHQARRVLRQLQQ